MIYVNRAADHSLWSWFKLCS